MLALASLSYKRAAIHLHYSCCFFPSLHLLQVRALRVLAGRASTTVIPVVAPIIAVAVPSLAVYDVALPALIGTINLPSTCLASCAGNDYCCINNKLQCLHSNACLAHDAMDPVAPPFFTSEGLT